jgi:hypothetical protein
MCRFGLRFHPVCILGSTLSRPSITTPPGVKLKHFPETAAHAMDSLIKAGSASMGTIPTLEQGSTALRLVDEVNAPRMVSHTPCENCGSLNVLSTLVASRAVYWRCQDCGELSASIESLLPGIDG